MIKEEIKNVGSSQSSFFSLMADGGTDVSTRELEIMHIRFIKDGSVANW